MQSSKRADRSIAMEAAVSGSRPEPEELATLTEQLRISEAALADAQAHQRATSEILEAISRSRGDVEPVFESILRRAVALCEAAYGFILRYDGRDITLVAHHNLAAEGVRLLQSIYPIQAGPESLVGRAVLERRVVHVHDILAERGYRYSALQQSLGYRTIVTVPLLRQSEPIGAIAVYRTEVAPFSDRQIALLQIFANQAVIAVDNAQSFAEIEEKNRTIQEQAAQLAEWNRTLEMRVAEQVTQLGRMSRLTRFLSPKVSDLIVSSDAEEALKARRAEITVVYVDLRGFTGFTESAEPEEVMSVLRQYHGELGKLIMAHDGTIEHFAGDGMMIMFNAPLPVADHEFKAIRMALAMRATLSELSTSWRERGHELGFGVGIASGYATIGTIGFEYRLDYGAIGPATNLAARLCGEAKNMQILIAPRVFAKLKDRIEAEPVGELTLKGFHRPVPAYNVLGTRGG
jgi:adenylate cyclase